MEKDLSLIMERVVLNKDFKIYGTMEKPYFLAKDVASWIDHKQSSRLVDLVDEDEKGMFIKNTLGGTQKMWFLTEEGVYEILMQSRKPIAKLFRKEVKAILREIRKNGLYVTESRVDEFLDNPDLVIQLLKRVKYSNERVRSLSCELAFQKSKVVFAEAVEEAEDTIYIGDLAKLIKQNGVDIGQNRLFKWFRDNGYLIKKRRFQDDMPTQMAMDLELFKVNEVVKSRRGGGKRISKTVRVTGRGQVYFINKFLS